VAPCLVLTNGTAPLIRRVHQLEQLKSTAHPLAFRVSIDHANVERHDAGRGWGNFRRALDGLALLHQRGFAVSVTRQMTSGEDAAAVASAFRNLFTRLGLPPDLPVVALPDYGLPGQEAVPPVVANSELAQRPLMCSHSKMLVKRNGRLRVYACPLVDDAEIFDQGATLAEALSRDTVLMHARCRTCVQSAASMSALQLLPTR
jgi:hypothetical protein